LDKNHIIFISLDLFFLWKRFYAQWLLKNGGAPGVHHFLIIILVRAWKLDCDTTLAGCHQRCQTSEAIGLGLILLLLKVPPSAVGDTDCRL
jgi:hypothetical protein